MDDTDSAAQKPAETPAGTSMAAPGEGNAAPREKKKESWGSFLRFLLILFLATLVLRSCIVAPFSIPSGSMLPNLLIGDYLFVAKWPYGYSRYSFPFGIINFDGRVMGSVPERGDVVVFHYPGAGNQDWVKRVIGVPGDRVEVRGGQVVLNGQAVPRQRLEDFVVPVSPNSPCQPRGTGSRLIQMENGSPACSYLQYRETLPNGRSYNVLDQVQDNASSRHIEDSTDVGADNVAPFTVPADHVFAMGDNRDDSLDSRFPLTIRDGMGGEHPGGVGLLPVENIEGRALISFFSTDGSAQWLLPWSWFSAARWSRFGITYQ